MFTNFYTFFISYIFIISSVLGYGLLICNLINKSIFSKNIGYVGLTGIFFLTIYSYSTSLFISHGQYHNLIFLILGLIFFYLNRNYLRDNLKNNFLILCSVFGILIIGLFIFKTHDDFSYYHFQYSYYLTQQPSVIGIGNFGLGLRTTSSLFYLNSLFYLPIIEFYSFQITPALILGFSNLILLIKIKNDISRNRYNFLTIYNLLVFIFINIFFYRLSEHGTDRSAQILILILFSEIMLMINFKAIIEKSISKIFILIGLVISFKAFYILYIIFLAIIIYQLIKLKISFDKIIKIFIKNIFFISFIFLLFLILLHNFLISGCLIYPVSLTCFENNFWAIKINEVDALNSWYEQWAKGGASPNFRVEDPVKYIQNFNWVSNWINIYFFNKVSDFLLGLSTLVLVSFFILRSRKIKLIKKKNIYILIFFIFVLLFEWFYNHPALRYGGYCLIASIVFIYFSIYLEKFDINKKLLKKKIYVLISIAFIVFTLRNFKRIQYEVTAYNYKPLKEFNFYFDDKHFNLQNNLDYLIANFDQCKNLDNNCLLENDKNLIINKMYGKYVFKKK